MKVNILCKDYYWEGIPVNLGGLQKYVWHLAQHLSKSCDVTIWQKSDKEFSLRERGGVDVIGTGSQSFKHIVKRIENSSDPACDLLIFASHYFIVKHNFVHSIAIQHGIAWDHAGQAAQSRLRDITDVIKTSIRAIKTSGYYFRHCSNIVCVDSNFANWFRAQVRSTGAKLHVISNFSMVPAYSKRPPSDTVSVIFARRLQEYRGTRLFTKAILNVLNKHQNVRVTIAGGGSDQAWMQQQLQSYETVNFINYKLEDSLDIHQKYDIAVVPSLGSEGTSLSLLEAMAAGCAVIATNIGGLTDIILDAYNGLLVSPDEQSLTGTIEKMVTDREMREQLSQNAYQTVSKSFSYDKWICAWDQLIDGEMKRK